MDVETASAIEGVTDRIDTLETVVRGDIDGLRGDIARLDTRVENLGDRVVALEVTLRAEIAETRRHAVLLNEGTRDDIRMVAEAVAVLTVKVDALRR